MQKERRRHALGRTVVVTGCLLLLAACQTLPPAADRGAWTAAELAEVFDLSELGASLQPAPSGDHLLLDGRVLPADVLQAFPHMTHGRSSNLLRLSADALQAMAPEVASHLLQASPTELRAHLAGFGLSAGELRRAWADRGELDLAGLLSLAERLDRGAFHGASATGAGGRLLQTLGVSR